MQLFDLRGKAAIITGGNAGIGLGMARGLLAAGANLLIVGRDAGRNAQAQRDLQALAADGQRVENFVADVADADGGKRIADQMLATFGRYDILVNNAGFNQRKPPQDYTLGEWQRILDVNLTGAFLCSQAAYPAMAANPAGGSRGKIINIGSMTSLFGAPLAAAYGASKGGIVQLTRALAAAWATDDIQVNAVLPGWIDTELTRAGRASAPQMYTHIEARTPAGRWGQPEDLAGIAVFLSSAASDFITGAAIPVDGGYSIKA